MTANLKKFEEELVKFYSRRAEAKDLAEAANYSLMAGGKRIRPLFLLETLEGFGLELKDSYYQVAIALEMIHTGSLIHDDLPAMDNDDYRRGKLTNHKVFGDALAILAGDSLFLDPWLILTEADLEPEVRLALIRELSTASGALGMVSGQVFDMAAEKQSLTLAELKQLHSLKTGRLLTFPFVAAAIIAKRSESEIAELREIGEKVGLAFQIRDDILDVTASKEELGKTPGKDELEGKSTYVSLLGLAEAKNQFNELMLDIEVSLSHLDAFNSAEVMKLVDRLKI